MWRDGCSWALRARAEEGEEGEGLKTKYFVMKSRFEFLFILI